MSKVENAAYALVHATRDRARDIAERTGIKLQVLINKVSLTCDRNHLMLDEAVRIEQASGDFRILYAHADELGHVCIPKPTSISDDDVAHALTRLCAEFGDYLRKVDESLKDERVTPNERRQLEKELAEMIASATHLQAVLAGKGHKR